MKQLGILSFVLLISEWVDVQAYPTLLTPQFSYYQKSEDSAVQEELPNSEGLIITEEEPVQEEVVVQEAPKTEYKVFDPYSIQDSDRLWIDGELLFWKMSEGGLNYAIKSSSTTTINGRTESPDADWNFGFRLGIGTKMPHDKWDLYVGYTYVHATASGHTSGTAVFPTWMSPFASGGGYAKSASAHLHTNVDIADIELGRTCFVSNWLSMRPFLSVRGLIVDQDYNVAYQGGTAAPGDKYKNKMQSDFWGVGLRMGVDTLWGLGKGFSIYGNGAASLLSGHFSNRQKEKFANAGTTYVNLKDNFSNVVPTAEVALGIQWDYLFHRERCHFGFKFGWEFNVLFDQNRLVRLVGDTAPGSFTRNNDDLAFQGLTLGLRFDF